MGLRIFIDVLVKTQCPAYTHTQSVAHLLVRNVVANKVTACDSPMKSFWLLQDSPCNGVFVCCVRKTYAVEHWFVARNKSPITNRVGVPYCCVGKLS